MKKQKIAVLVSGGVDSSVVLRLLVDQGHDVTAFYLKIWLEDEAAFLGICPWEEDLKYVRAVCDQLHVPLEIVPLQKEYHERVVDYTIKEVTAGRTPNPDVLCNQQVKFGAFFDAIDDSFEKVATGHYAQVEEKEGVYYLKKAPDAIKDQTYFLTLLDQSQLSRALFPIGQYSKREVRSLAEKFDLPTKTRKDSQGLCFLGKIKYDDFIRFHVGEKEGDIICKEDGQVLGKHKGYWFHTIGQRHGLELSGGPWYVVEKDMKRNRVYVSHQASVTKNDRSSFDVGSFHWIATQTTKKELSIKVRHGAVEHSCEIICSEDSINVHVELTEGAQGGIASGQFAVLYDGEYCLGGGMIL